MFTNYEKSCLFLGLFLILINIFLGISFYFGVEAKEVLLIVHVIAGLAGMFSLAWGFAHRYFRKTYLED